MWLVPKTTLTTTMTAQSARGQWANRKQRKSHAKCVLERMISSTMLLKRCSLPYVVYGGYKRLK